MVYSHLFNDLLWSSHNLNFAAQNALSQRLFVETSTLILMKVTLMMMVEIMVKRTMRMRMRMRMRESNTKSFNL